MENKDSGNNSNKVTEELLNSLLKEVVEEELENEDEIVEFGDGFELNLPEGYESEDRVSQILDISRTIQTYKVSEKFKEKYEGLPERVIKDLEIFTKVRKEMLNSERVKADSIELENYRRFPEGTLQKRGVIYSEGLDTMNLFPDLKYSSFGETINDAFQERYLLPITMPDGDVFTYMGYDPHDEYNKYQVPKITMEPKDNWIKQGRMLGNLESLGKYPKGTPILIVEGYFDAVHAEEIFKRPTIATLGANVRAGKLSLMYQIKQEYKAKMILIPDFDRTGMDEYHIKKEIWDAIYNFNLGKNSEEMYKDIDDYLVETPKEELRPLPI